MKKKEAIKPIFSSKRIGFSKWAITHFPDNYQNMIYLEPYYNDLSILINKEKSNVEIINHNNESILNIYRSVRNEPKEFLNKIRKHKISKKYFDTIQSQNVDKLDYLESAVAELFLIKSSLQEQKSLFNKNLTLTSWKSYLKNISNFSKRINEVFLFNENPIFLIESFNFEDCFLYCSPPHLKESNNSKKLYESDISMEEHKNISYLLDSFKGKVILSGIISPLYKRIYKNWNIFKSSYKSKNKKLEVIWKNF